MKCFHHTDADGKCAAFWVHDRYPHMKQEDFIMIDYGMNINWFSMIEQNEPIIIVDFSFDPDDMRKILNKTKNVTWIDHHQSAIDKYKDFEYNIKGLRYNGYAGCILTWVYFNRMNDGRIEFDTKMTKEAPWMTKYIHDRDVWKFEFGEETKHFNLGLDACGTIKPLDPIWDKLLNIDEVRKLITDGQVIEKYRDAIGARAVEMYSFETNFHGYKILCLNNIFGGSEWFGDIMDKYDAVCAFMYMGKDKKWEYSLYSEKIDVSKIAKMHGGGGHAGASGFVDDKFIF